MEVALSSEFTFQYVKANEGVAVSGANLFAGLENTYRIHPPQLVMSCVQCVCACVRVCVCACVCLCVCLHVCINRVLDFAIAYQNDSYEC